jgi:hypothetical protein
MNDREDILLWSEQVTAKKLHAREMRQGMPSTPASTRLFGRTLDDATNSYKFFWLQALLSVIGRQPELIIPVRAVVAEMLVAAWHPVMLYRLSLGLQDMLQHAVRQLQTTSGVRPAASVAKVRKTVIGVSLDTFAPELDRYVPFRFLAPWFDSELRGVSDTQRNRRIRELAAATLGGPRSAPYAFDDDATFPRMLRFDQGWLNWMHENLAVLQAFADQGLTQYLQSRNPGVPGISAKLHPPLRRGLDRGKKFWAAAISALGSEGRHVEDIYTGAVLGADLSIDHFLPWSFVAHDLLWNLVPVTPATNSSKSDRIPDLDRYLPRLADLHRSALHALRGQPSLLMDHITFLAEDLPTLLEHSSEWFLSRYAQAIRPLAELAALQGFPPSWMWSRVAEGE